MHSSVLVAVSTVLVGAHPLRADAVKPRKSGSHEFDFEFGTWQTHLKRRLRPLSGSNVWVEYDGTTSDQPIWHGQANLLQLEADGPSGHIEALSLRLYREDTNQWSLNFANSTVGTTSTPSIGTIQGGRGEFIDQETFGARVILVRFIITRISSTACHFEQSFSEDGGKSWEVNWIADDRLIARPASRSMGFSIAAAAAVVFASLLTQPVHAQRADDNAISAAQDAFGTSVGLQSIGLYSPTSTRGFNPTQAGNLHIDGLYFDQQTASNNLALFSGSETEDNRYKLPPLSAANVGARYTRKLFNRECSLRFDVSNITNASGLAISPIYVVLPQLRRNYMVTAAIDL